MYNGRRRIAGVAGVLALISLAAAAWFSVLLARADAQFRKGTLEGVARAVELTPRNTAYLSLRASQVEYSGGDPRPLLEEIDRLNPDSSAPRIRLGLDAEIRGDLPDAERWLLDAARVDRQFEPRWTLANFYFRHDNDQFWTWMRSAFEASYGDRIAAFDLCERANSDTQTIMARAIPNQHEVVAAFLKYLLNGEVAGVARDAAPVAERLSQWRDPADLRALYQEMDRLLIAGRRPEARHIWINLGYADPPLVFNPDFGPPRIGHGFDWWLIPHSGVTYVPLDTQPALRISFNGMQPESAELLRQYIGIHAGTRYLLRWESRGIASGITWRIGSQSAPLRAGDDWTPGQLSFILPNASPNAGVAGDALSLFYNRPLGEVRLEGSVELRHVEIVEP